MKKICFVLLCLFCLSGCYSTAWECRSFECQYMTYQMAKNRCLAQANAAYSDNTRLIWRQCMMGYGFEEVNCKGRQYGDSPCVFMGMHTFSS